MRLDERFRKFPIKFYQTDKGIYFENAFIKGEAKDLNDAFNQLKNKLDDYELFYYYDDIAGSKVGAFEPAYRDKKTKNGIYLGKLNLDIDIDDSWKGEHTVTYLSKNPDKIKDHEKFIKKLKNAKKRDEFFAKLKDGIKKVAGYLHLTPKYEMFDPYKSRYDLICEHCGEIIPTGSYYEEWHGKDYHLECIWDKLTNDKKSNTHEEALKYFLSLEEFIDNWDGGLDCLTDYESDLELYKNNKRRGLSETKSI